MCVCVCSQEYERALKYIDAVTHIEPANHQARQLHNYIKKKMEKGNCESVAQSKSTYSQKPQLGMIEHGHQMDGWPLHTRTCTHLEISPETNSVQTLQKSFYKVPRVYMHAKNSRMHVKDPVVYVRVQWTVETAK